MAQDQVAGFIGAFVAAILWGSFAVPIKLVDTGDGLVFQWIECSAILIVGMINEFIVGTYKLYPMAMIGGVLWCIGNVTVVPIVKWIGLGMGLLVWGVSNLLTGWLCGHFGIFVAKDVPPHPILNYLGLAAAVLSVFLYLPVKSVTNQSSGANVNSSEKYQALNDDGYAAHSDEEFGHKSEEKKQPFITKEKALGLGLSIVAGVLYGSNMIPVQALKDKDPSANPLEFALSHFLGIWLTSTAIVIGYSIVKKNNPFINPRFLLPAVVAGLGWGIAQSAGFIANANLGLTSSFPILCTGPGVVGSLWGIFAFKEIRGWKNYLWLGGAFGLTFVGIILITLSKVEKL